MLKVSRLSTGLLRACGARPGAGHSTDRTWGRCLDKILSLSSSPEREKGWAGREDFWWLFRDRLTHQTLAEFRPRPPRGCWARSQPRNQMPLLAVLRRKSSQTLGTWLLHLPGFSHINGPVCHSREGAVPGEWAPWGMSSMHREEEAAWCAWRCPCSLGSLSNPARVQGFLVWHSFPFGWVFKSIIFRGKEAGLWFWCAQCSAGTWAPARCSHLGQAVLTANPAWPRCPAWYRGCSSAKMLGNPLLSKEITFRLGFFRSGDLFQSKRKK